MATPEKSKPDPESKARLSPSLVLILIGWGLMFFAYTSVFTVIGGDPVLTSMKRAAINTIPAALLSWPIFQLIDRKVIALNSTGQAAFHFGLALTYAFLWYVGVQVGYGLQSGWANAGIIGRPLAGVALTWQMFQGVTLYAAIAGFSYAHIFWKRWELLRDEKMAAGSRETAKRLFIRDGKAIRPVDLDTLYCLSGAGDYVEVTTRHETFMSGTALSGFEAELPSDLFLRVHRSHIVRVDAILSVESAGNGRLTLHLPKGLSVTTSRAGASAFRERAL